MAILPSFTFGPPPQAVRTTYDSRTNQFVATPNPEFYIWTHRLWSYLNELANSTDALIVSYLNDESGNRLLTEDSNSLITE